MIAVIQREDNTIATGKTNKQTKRKQSKIK
jgi:hypothetical protein